VTAARWARITDLFQTALDKPPGERGAFLDQVCSSDEPLRRNVERLLAAHGEPSLPSPVSEFLESDSLEIAEGEILAHYRVERKVGEGGMGAVYRGYDTKLRRTVALKVLAPERFTDQEHKGRLLREARAASGLNHPNVVTIYEIGADKGVDFIAMEYVEGETLSVLIPTEGLVPRQLFRYALQITDALAKAHGAGVLHRDLKPANIMVTREGTVKLLDFGLATMFEPDASPNGSIESDVQTQEGLVAGTLAYMSPEQAEGRKLDARSDLFSLGTVLYEMATGARPFCADTRAGLLNRIVNEDAPAPREIAPIPQELEQVILRCLRKDPVCRYQSAGEVRAALEDLDLTAESPAGRARPASGAGPVRRRRAIRKSVAITGVVIAAAMTIVAVRTSQRSPEAIAQRTVKFTITPANLVRSSAVGEIDAEVSISRDGRHIAYVESAGGQLWIRDLDQEQAHPVPGAVNVYQVFWSPDNEWIGYSAGAHCEPRGGCDLVRIPVQGGTPVRIAKLQGLFRRASWSADGQTVLFCDMTGMYTVPARGGPVTRIVEHPHIEHPSFLELPGGRRAYLYQAHDKEQPVHTMYVQVAGETQRHLVAQSSSVNPYPAYSPTGHIIYVDGNRDETAIWALPFSLNTLQATGKPFPIAQHGASPAVSQTGSLVYSDVASDRQQLVIVNRAGEGLGTIGEMQRQNSPRLSPSGRQLVVEVGEGASDLWVYDLERGGRTRLTSDAASERLGAWTPRGDQITYSSVHSGIFDFVSKPLDGTGEAERLMSTPFAQMNPAWSPDGRFLMYTSVSPQTKSDLLWREHRENGSLSDPVVFLKTSFGEAAAEFSPDGRFVAYVSDEAGSNDVYVRDFPRGENQWRVSTSGGIAPRWRRDGREIFYVAQNSLMAVGVTTRPGLAVGTAARLFEKRHLRTVGGGDSLNAQYDVWGDGKRFVIFDRPGGEQQLSIHVIHNWFEEFRSRSPKYSAGS
jgi:eukaryotic-like serine/threonine-protein kinase